MARFWKWQREGQHELRWTNPHRFVMRGLRETLQYKIDHMALPAAAKVLDFGCALKPYRDLFGDNVDYIGADLPGNAVADVTITEDGRLPMADASIDLVFSTQVLEHVAEPHLYLQECFRVLKPGGKLLLTTHGIWIYHRDPVDYWRWTSEGLGLATERAGGVVQEMSGVMGLAAVAIQLFQDATLSKLPGGLRQVYGGVMQSLVGLVDRFHSDKSRLNNAMVYVLVAQKPERDD